MRSNRTVRLGGLAIMAALAAMPFSALGQHTPQSALLVSGKEYSNLTDQDKFGAPVAGQVVLWDGTGATVDDGIIPNPVPGASHEVDALANHGDAYFQEVSYFNSAALLFSIAGDPGSTAAPAAKRAVLAHNDLGAVSVWAYNNVPGPTVNGLAGTVNDLDGLEVWGPDGSSDATAFSGFGDIGGVAVWDRATLTPIVTTADMHTLLAPFGLGANDRVDLDALMMGSDPTDPAFGQAMLFSIRPTAGFDGGEIWVANLRTMTAKYLVHGGRVWDTLNDVSHLSDCNEENIDALEAVNLVPEPASMAVLGLGALGLLRRRAKKA